MNKCKSLILMACLMVLCVGAGFAQEQGAIPGKASIHVAMAWENVDFPENSQELYGLLCKSQLPCLVVYLPGLRHLEQAASKERRRWQTIQTLCDQMDQAAHAAGQKVGGRIKVHVMDIMGEPAIENKEEPFWLIMAPNGAGKIPYLLDTGIGYPKPEKGVAGISQFIEKGLGYMEGKPAGEGKIVPQQVEAADMPLALGQSGKPAIVYHYRPGALFQVFELQIVGEVARELENNFKLIVVPDSNCLKSRIEFFFSEGSRRKLRPDSEVSGFVNWKQLRGAVLEAFDQAFFKH